MTFFSTTALASLIPTMISGQQVIFIPASSLSTMMMSPASLSGSPMGSSSSGGEGEPPCRQRRLEPWRHEIRKVCHVDADDHCGSKEKEKEDMRDLRYSPMETPFDTMEGMNSLFNAMFANPSQELQKEEDPFESLLNEMMGFSLRAFDNMMINVDVVSVPLEKEVEAEEEPKVLLSSSEDGTLDATAPAEQAAENALDAMVASLAQRSVQQGEIDTPPPGEDEDTTIMIPSVTNLPLILSQMGFDIVSENRSTRRRLLEGGEAMDPHFRVRERLARRLTEYRTDLFFDSDGTVTMYTSSGLFPSSSFMTPSSSMRGLGSVEPTYETPLGMGSTFVDQCMRSVFENGDLGEQCNDAVQQLLNAVDNRYLVPPSTKEEAKPPPTIEPVNAWTASFSTKKSNPYEVDGSAAFMYCAMFLVLVLALDRYFSGSDNEEEETSDGYERMPEDDNTNGHPVARGETRLFVGVPVQVV